MSDQENTDHIKDVIRQLERRRNILELQNARQGIVTEPSVILEIEDINAKIASMRASLEDSSDKDREADASLDLSCSPILWPFEIPIKIGIRIFKRINR